MVIYYESKNTKKKFQNVFKFRLEITNYIARLAASQINHQIY